MAKEPKVDAYIAAQAAFAQLILTHLRGLIHAASPDRAVTGDTALPNSAVPNSAVPLSAGPTD